MSNLINDRQLNAKASESFELAHTRTIAASAISASPIYHFLLGDAEIVSARPGEMRTRLVCSDRQLNSSGSLHGSFSATATDWAGGMSIVTLGYGRRTGVSVDIHVSYLAGARIGDVLEIEGRVDRVGRSMGFTTVVIEKVEGEKRTVVARGSHTKFLGGIPTPTDLKNNQKT